MSTAMMRKCRLLQIGLGSVGQEFARQLLRDDQRWQAELQLSIGYCGFFTSRGGAVSLGSGLSSFTELQMLLESRALRSAPPDGFLPCPDPMALLAEPHWAWGSWADTLIVDTSTADTLYPFMEEALARGASLIVANKKLLAGCTAQEFSRLCRFGPRRLRCEATVGAGLPVISTLRSLLASGDEMLEIWGCMSGTLGFICSALESGTPFSTAVRLAGEQGFTEPDPRVDLSGQDVARKTLILARLSGQPIEPDQLSADALYPAEMAQLDSEQFLQRLPELDPGYAARMQLAQSRGNTLRYVGRVTPSGCSVGLAEVAVGSGSGLGSLRGPENWFGFKTRRYLDYPLSIQGPGAGPQVTAAGVLADVLAATGAL